MGAFSSLTIILLLTISIETALSDCNDVAKAFKDNEVEPDVVSDSPTKLVEVNYPNGVSVNLGNELTPSQVKDKPALKWDAEPNTFYTLLMVDPDAPSRTMPFEREYRHWAIVNIPGYAVEKGETVFDYIGSAPPEGTGLHRYIFLVYKQPNGKIQNNETSISSRSLVNRAKTSAKDFSRKYNLGDAKFGNMFQAQYDDYVPIFYKQFN